MSFLLCVTFYFFLNRHLNLVGPIDIRFTIGLTINPNLMARFSTDFLVRQFRNDFRLLGHILLLYQISQEFFG